MLFRWLWDIGLLSWVICFVVGVLLNLGDVDRAEDRGEEGRSGLADDEGDRRLVCEDIGEEFNRQGWRKGEGA